MSIDYTKHLIIISFDALSSKDYDTIQTLPNFKELINNGSYAKKVYSIYPTLTYPAHTTIITGKYPNKHGIINNTLLQPKKASPDWYWQRKYINAATLYDLAKENNLTTCSLLWPVTGQSSIDYNMPEIFANRWWQNQILVSLINGSPIFQIDLNNRFGKTRKGISQPELDDFILKSAVYTLTNYKPNLTMIHFTDLDTQRHNFGYSSKAAMQAIIRHDYRLGEIIKALKAANIYENSSIIAIGDHSAIDVNKTISINTLFKNRGLIQTNKKGKILSWKAYMNSCDGSAYIYINNNDYTIYEKIKNILEEFVNNEESGIEAIYYKEDLDGLKVDCKASFMLEAKKGYYFIENITELVINNVDELSKTSTFHSLKASHGYSPLKDDYSTMFIASGKGIKKRSEEV
jgi:Uncharacterized proteins of the AP superfamily